MELRPEIVSELWHSDLIESEDCGLEESQEFYRQVKEGRDLPPDVWQIGDTARFIRLKDGAPSPRSSSSSCSLSRSSCSKASAGCAVFRGADRHRPGPLVLAVAEQHMRNPIG